MDVKNSKILSLDALTKKAAFSEIASIGSVVNKIMQTVKNPNSSAMELKNIIEIDPPLCAKILRRANSSFYSLPRKISAIQEAIVLIGFTGVREMAMSLKVGKLFTDDKNAGNTYSRKKLWKHSLTVAILSKNIFRKQFREQGDNAYSAGLMHDIGIIAEEQFMPEEFKTLFAESDSAATSLHDREKRLFKYTHTEVGRELMRAWNMPEELIATIGYHHNPLLNTNPSVEKALMTIHVAETLCNMNGLGVEGNTDSQLATHARLLSVLGITSDAIELILEDTIEEIERLETEGELYP